MMKILAWLFALLLLSASTTFGSEVHLARASWSAFECSALAGEMGDDDEVQRLFEYGFSAGKQFLEAVEAGKITDEAARTTAPVGFLWAISGPSNDFILGRVYERAMEHALKDIFEAVAGSFPDEPIRRIRAETGYSSGNCTLLGR